MAKFPVLKKHLTIIALGYLTTGLGIPSLSLIITSKGFSLFQLSVAMFCYSLFAVVFEVPSGIFCDAKGRRTSYQLGQVFSLCGTGCFFSSHFPVLCLGFAFNGIGRAFASGSLDALIIEDHLSHGGTMDQVVMALEITSSAALAVGSLGGGFLLTMGTAGPQLTNPVLAIRGMLILLNLILLQFLIQKDTVSDTQGSPSFARQVQIFVNQTKANRFLLIYVLFTLFQGFQLASLESYWQPYLKSLLTSQTDFWFLGALGSSLFFVSIIGSVLGKSLMSRGRPSRLFLLGMGLSFLFEAVLPFVPSIATFCLPYVLIYLNLGIASVVGGCLLNDSLDSSVRSSSLSLNSFALQIGGIFSILLAMVVLRHGAIGRLWILTSAICMLFLLVISRPFLRSIQDQRHNKTQEEREGKTERKGYGIEDLVQPQNENS